MVIAIAIAIVIVIVIVIVPGLTEDIHSEDLTIKSGEISVVVERECLTDILGPVKIDFTDKNLVEQGFVFEQLVNGHQCGCGESFTPVRDLKKSHS